MHQNCCIKKTSWIVTIVLNYHVKFLTQIYDFMKNLYEKI